MDQEKKADLFGIGFKKISVALAFMLFAGLTCSGSVLAQSAQAHQQILLTEAARVLGVSTSWKPAEGKLSLIRGNHTADILIGGDRLKVDGSLLSLSSPVVIVNGSVRMAATDARDVFSRLLGREVSMEEILSAGIVSRDGYGAREHGRIETVRYISYPRFTRLIITVAGSGNAEDIEVAPSEADRELVVSFPRLLPPYDTDLIEVRDRILESVEIIQSGRGTRLAVIPQMSKIEYEVQRHNDPPRIVLDVRSAEPTIMTNFKKTGVLTPQADEWSAVEPAPPQERSPFITVVIDPGHGGKDLGASGHGGLVEKNVTLDIAMKLKDSIDKKPGMKAVLTRTGDYFVSLKERTTIANQARDGTPADLFISIHTNSHRSSKVGGFEAYYISDALDPSAEATAALENAVIDLELNGSGEIKPGLKLILWDLQFSEFVSESSEFAFIAQEELARRLNTRDRGVRQAQFIVLQGVAMPSILVEVGFISNRIEEAKLKTADFKDRCSEALAAAVMVFKERYETRLGLLRGK